MPPFACARPPRRALAQTPRVAPPTTPELTMLSQLLRQMESHARSQLAAPAPVPFVTVTFAQSLDGSVAGPKGADGPRLLLSGDESMRMTRKATSQRTLKRRLDCQTLRQTAIHCPNCLYILELCRWVESF